MKGFIKVHRDRLNEFWLYPLSLHLLLYISYRVRRSDSGYENNLQVGECLLGDYNTIGITRQEYRTAVKRLTDWKIVEFRTTNRGTIARLIDSSIFDPNIEPDSNQQINHPSNQPSNQQKKSTATTQTTNRETNREEVSNSIETVDFEELKTSSNQQSNQQINQQKTEESTNRLTTSSTTSPTTNKEVINKNDLKEVNKEKKKSGKISAPSLFGDVSEKNHLFKDSIFADFEKFKEKFSAADFENVNIDHYYNLVKDWSASKNVKRADWIAQARSIMRTDNEEGKLKLKKPESIISAEDATKKAERFLKNDY